MNKIIIEDHNGFFKVFWRKVQHRVRGGKAQEVNMNRFLFVTGGRVGDSTALARVEAERLAEEFRQKHPDIGDIVFKKMQK